MGNGFTTSVGTSRSSTVPPQFPQNFAGLLTAGALQLFEQLRSDLVPFTGEGGMTR
jgi:hypothetical protein